MKMNDLKSKNTEELKVTLSDLRTKMAKLSFELEANTLKDSSQIKKAKRDIARVLTVLRRVDAKSNSNRQYRE